MGSTRLSKSKSSCLESLWFPSKLPIRNEVGRSRRMETRYLLDVEQKEPSSKRNQCGYWRTITSMLEVVARFLLGAWYLFSCSTVHEPLNENLGHLLSSVRSGTSWPIVVWVYLLSFIFRRERSGVDERLERYLVQWTLFVLVDFSTATDSPIEGIFRLADFEFSSSIFLTVVSTFFSNRKLYKPDVTGFFLPLFSGTLPRHGELFRHDVKPVCYALCIFRSAMIVDWHTHTKCYDGWWRHKCSIVLH